MRASTLIRDRRLGGSWLFYAFPPDHDEDTRRPPDPPPEKKEGAPAKERRVQRSRPPAPAGRAAQRGYHE